MAPTSFEKTGTASFPSQPGQEYRVVVTATPETLNVWLQDRTSKKQWVSGFVGLSEFVDATNAIPHATFGDYCQLLAKTLVSTTESMVVDGFARDLRKSDDGALTLTITVLVNVLDKKWTAAFTIAVRPVPLECIDILEARLADIEEEGCSVCKAAARVPPISEFAVTVMATSVRESRQCMWKVFPGGCFSVQHDGDIIAHQAGTYLLALRLLYVSGVRQPRIAVWKGDALVLEDASGIKTDASGSLYMTWPLQFDAGMRFFIITSYIEVLPGSKMTLTFLH